jgi:hypothetical protein
MHVVSPEDARLALLLAAFAGIRGGGRGSVGAELRVVVL